MIYVLSGGTSLYTVIAVTYPAGSICTCGGKAAKDTSGYALFNVKAGTYTVECHTSNNSKSKSTSVTIAASDIGKSKSVTLSYELILFDAGSSAPGTVEWTKSGSTLSISATTTLMNSASDTVRTRDKISVSGYSTLHFQITSSSQVANGYRRVGLSEKDSGSDFSYYKDVTGTGEVTVPVSSATVPLFVRMEVNAWPEQNGQTATTSMVASKVWLT